MGDVWLAKHNTMDRKVAIKVLSSRFSGDNQFIERFLNEARTLAKLQHPNIVSAYDAGSHKGIYYLVMNYVEGVELDKVIYDRGHLNEVESLLIASAVAGALAHAWNEFKIIHRDIKPGNIILDSKGKPYLMDLGISKSLHDDSKGITVAGSGMFGTPDFMSPEQISGAEKIDFRSDIYSLGATLYQMLTGRTPYSAETPLAVAAKHMTEPVPSPRQANPLISANCDAMVRKMMSKAPAERYASWELLLKDIEKVMFGEMPSAISSSARTATSSANSFMSETRKPRLLTENNVVEMQTVGATSHNRTIAPPVVLRTQDIFAKKRKPSPGTKTVSARKAASRGGKPAYLLLAVCCLLIVASAVAAYFFLEKQEPAPEQNSEHVMHPDSIENNNASSGIVDKQTISIQEQYSSTGNLSRDEISKPVPSASADEERLRQVAKANGIQYPPPPPSKSVDEIKLIIKEEIQKARSDASPPTAVFQEEEARNMAVKQLGLKKYPAKPAMTFDEVRTEHKRKIEEYVELNLDSKYPKFNEAEEKEHIKKAYSLQDAFQPLCSKEEAFERFQKAVDTKFYEELREKGLPSPKDTSLVNQKKVLELVPLYKRMKDNIKNEIAISFFKKLGFYVLRSIPGNSNSKLNPNNATGAICLTENLDYFIANEIKFRKAALEKKQEKERKKLVVDAKRLYPESSFYPQFGYIRCDDKWASAYDLANSIVEKKREDFNRMARLMESNNEAALAKIAEQIERKIYAENNYIRKDGRWLTYQEYLSAVAQNESSVSSHRNYSEWIRSEFEREKTRLAKLEGTIWKLIAINLLAENESMAEKIIRSGAFEAYYLHVKDKYKAYTDSGGSLKATFSSLRNDMAAGRMENARGTAIKLGGELSDALLEILGNYETKILPEVKNSPASFWKYVKNAKECQWDGQKWIAPPAQKSSGRPVTRFVGKTSTATGGSSVTATVKNQPTDGFHITSTAIDLLCISALFLGEYDLEFYDYEVVPAEVVIRGNILERPEFIFKFMPPKEPVVEIAPEVHPKTIFADYIIAPGRSLKDPRKSVQIFDLNRYEWADSNSTSLFSSRQASPYSSNSLPLVWTGPLFQEGLNVVNQNDGYICDHYLACGSKCMVSFKPFSFDILTEKSHKISVADLAIGSLLSWFIANNPKIKSINLNISVGIKPESNPWEFLDTSLRMLVNNPILPETEFYMDHYSHSTDIKFNKKRLLNDYIELQERRFAGLAAKRKARRERYVAEITLEKLMPVLKLSSDESGATDFQLAFSRDTPFPSWPSWYNIRVNFAIRPTAPISSIADSSLLGALVRKPARPGNIMEREGLNMYITGMELTESGTTTIRIGGCEAKLSKREHLE